MHLVNCELKWLFIYSFLGSVLSAVLILFVLLDGTQCAIDITCQQFRKDEMIKDICHIDNIAVAPSVLPSVVFYVDYADLSDIEEVYFAPATISDSMATKNEFKAILPGLLSIFPNLVELSMEANLREINSGDFNHAINLINLFIPHNNFRKIKYYMFTPHPKEFSLNCDGDAFPLGKLKSMDLSWNRISEIEAYSFSRLKSLEVLVLSNNELAIIGRGTFNGLSCLTHLYLLSNEIKTIEDGALDLPSLWLLDLANNKLKRLSNSVFDGLPKLEILRLHHNDMKHIGHSLYPLTNVKDISLDENRIKDIDLVAFAQMPSLLNLSLANSGFKFATSEIDDDSREWDSSLANLRLGNNRLSDATQLNQLKVFPNLEHLDIGENSLVNFDVGDDETLKDILPSLKSLTIEANTVDTSRGSKTVRRHQ